METKPEHNTSDSDPKDARKETALRRLSRKIELSKEARIGIVVTLMTTLISIIITIIFSLHKPTEKMDKVFRRNQKDGENQLEVWQLPPVQSFLEYLDCIVRKDSIQMWNRSSLYRREKLKSANGMMYDYYLTKDYQVEYIIPIIEEKKQSSKSVKNEHTFTFFAILKFEDDVCVVGEVDDLKNFQNTNLEKICDTTVFKPLFDQVVNEVYEFVDHRFVIDSAEYVKNKLREYMMDMTISNYVTQDWRFPVLFAKENKLPRKEPDGISTNNPNRQSHLMISKVVMIEDSVWKVREFNTEALSRWQ